MSCWLALYCTEHFGHIVAYFKILITYVNYYEYTYNYIIHIIFYYNNCVIIYKFSYKMCLYNSLVSLQSDCIYHVEIYLSVYVYFRATVILEYFVGRCNIMTFPQQISYDVRLLKSDNNCTVSHKIYLFSIVRWRMLTNVIGHV